MVVQSYGIALLYLMQDIWRKGEIVADWKDAKVVLMLKRGDLLQCDNWRGASSLDMVRKQLCQDHTGEVAGDS